MGGSVEHAMGWAYLAAQHTVQRDVATMTRNTEELRRLDAERGRVMADAATFLEELQPVIDGMPEEDRGYIVGQVCASAATTVVTGGIGTVPVIAAVATRTRTMANALLTARVLSKLPENRRDAFRQTVERLRDRSDRLEAPSEPAAMLCAMYESYCTENPSDRGWEAFKKTMLHAREWRDEGYVEPFNIRESLSIAVADEYRAGRVLTVQQVRDQLAWMPGRDAWLREASVQNHHVVPKNDVLLEMLRIKHVNDGLSREQLRAMVDTLEGSMPALPMDVDSHVVGVHSIHRIMDRLAREEPPDSIAD